MSWTNKSIERYEEQLRERWTPDGERIRPLSPKRQRELDVYMGQMAAMQSVRSEIFIDGLLDLSRPDYRAENTREICGND